MVKIISKGFTLIELIIYIGILSIILLSSISSLIHFQKIIQNYNQNYFIKNQIYVNLNIIQQYFLNNQFSFENNNLSFYKDNLKINTFVFSDNKINSLYYSNNKNISILENINFVNIKSEYVLNTRAIKFEFTWKDMFNREKKVTEYLIVINRKM